METMYLSKIKRIEKPLEDIFCNNSRERLQQFT